MLEQINKPPIFTPITLEEWKFVVGKAKKRSTSLIFSHRNYAMYKCVVGLERMNAILVRYYSMIIRQRYFPSRWLKILDIMIEKGKGPIVGKLRIIQLIEADLQMIMRIFINYRNKGKIESNSRISKVNYGSHNQYSFENSILEKRLIYNHSTFTYQ